MYDQKHVTEISHLLVPRLMWDDRCISYYVDNEGKSVTLSKIEDGAVSSDEGLEDKYRQPVLPKRLIVCGRYKSLENASGGSNMFCAIVDTSIIEERIVSEDTTMIKLFDGDSCEIISVGFGPFDNGHIILGLSTGHVLVLSQFDMASLYRAKVFDPVTLNAPVPVSSLTFDPL